MMDYGIGQLVFAVCKLRESLITCEVNKRGDLLYGLFLNINGLKSAIAEHESQLCELDAANIPEWIGSSYCETMVRLSGVADRLLQILHSDPATIGEPPEDFGKHADWLLESWNRFCDMRSVEFDRLHIDVLHEAEQELRHFIAGGPERKKPGRKTSEGDKVFEFYQGHKSANPGASYKEVAAEWNHQFTKRKSQTPESVRKLVERRRSKSTKSGRNAIRPKK